MGRYDYSLDMWSLGCMFAGLVFKKDTFFQGHDNNDQLVKIANVLGTETLFAYIEKYGVDLGAHFDGNLGRCPRKRWSKFDTDENKHLATDEAIELLDSMLIYDHAARILPREAMTCPYFRPLGKQGCDQGSSGCGRSAPTELA